jgi:peptidoglycan/LPS O-acetylase OafA/YrhL
LILVSLGDPLQMLPRFDGWAWYAFYLGNVHISLYGWQPLAVMILWSLAIEEQFYVMWPLLVQVCSERRVLLWSGAFMLVAPLTRALMSQEYPATYVFTLCRVDALAAGAIVAVLFASEKRWVEIAPWLNRLAPLAGIPIVTTLLAPFSPSFQETRPWFFTVFGYSCLAVSFAILLAVCLERRGLLGTLLTSPPLRFLGKRCYGLYVWHVVVAARVTAGLRPWQAGFHIHVLIWFAALLVVASASWVLLEQPILRLKDYLPYAQPRTGRTEVRLVA